MEFSPAFLLYGIAHPLGVSAEQRAALQDFYRVNVFADHPGGCYTCRWFGERVDPAVWYAHPGHQQLRSQAERGCAFWQRESGSATTRKP